jgi:hypothetical protein
LLSAGSRPRHQDLYDGSSEAVLPQDCRDFQNVATKDFSKLPKEQKLAGVFPMHSIGRLEPFQPKIRRLRTKGKLRADERAFRSFDTARQNRGNAS